MKNHKSNKRGGTVSGPLATPRVLALPLSDRIDRAIRGQYKARRYQLMDGAR